MSGCVHVRARARARVCVCVCVCVCLCACVYCVFLLVHACELSSACILHVNVCCVCVGGVGWGGG